MLLTKVGFPVVGPMSLYCDNKAVISIAHDPVQHDRTKHVEVDRHYIKDHLKQGHICTPYIQTQHQFANVFTKGLSEAQFMYLIGKLEMIDIYSSAWGGVLKSDIMYLGGIYVIRVVYSWFKILREMY